MFVYILIACVLGSGHGQGSGCISFELPDQKQCKNAGEVFKRKMDYNVIYYCQEVRKK